MGRKKGKKSRKGKKKRGKEEVCKVGRKVKVESCRCVRCRESKSKR